MLGKFLQVWKAKTERTPDFKSMVNSTFKLEVEKSAGIAVKYLRSGVLSHNSLLWTVFH